ncbi:Uncharacterized protein TCAP_01021 [Tolypocladium capitatum]|uniref:Uncharacterized protein n=1 Tax=Tolypocladium capitatum TaxID=45235 RepID=A0A2K3QNF5_9HYPO|nr:Uncharacterized protein TCAP_01021 [Tolypocladium capitatum]
MDASSHGQRAAKRSRRRSDNSGPETPDATKRSCTHARRQASDAAPERLSHADYAVGWVSALPLELAAAQAMLDETHQDLPQDAGDGNAYILGRIAQHNVVMACLPAGQYGIARAAVVAGNMRRTFRSIQIALMVGIGGGAPGAVDIRLGDVVVASGAVQYDPGEAVPPGRLRRTGNVREPPDSMATAVSKLLAMYESHPGRLPAMLSGVFERNQSMREYACPGPSQDLLFESAYDHPVTMDTCDACNKEKLLKRPPRARAGPTVHWGRVASASQAMRCGTARDQLADELGVLCFEMEAAGLAENFPCLVIRGICDYSDSHRDRQWQRYSAVVAAAYAKDLLSVMPTRACPGTCLAVRSGTNGDLPTLNRRRILLQSLEYHRINSRCGDVAAAQYKTCEWLLSHKAYLDWQDPTKLGQHDGFFCISGKPGSGKSTLIKFLYTHTAKETAGAITISFFFNARGTDLEKTTMGMHRSLLHQLLKQAPDLQNVLDGLDCPSARPEEIEWSIGLVGDVFAAAIAKLGPRRLTCLIDALDECQESLARATVAYFEDLGVRAAKSTTQLRVCFSSRHHPHMPLRKCLKLILQDQVGHKEDMEKYARENLKLDEGAYSEAITAGILGKADGVFMWAVLAVGILNKDMDEGDIFGLEEKLQELPEELGALFAEILTRDNRNMAEALLSLQWILYAERPLTSDEFYFAVKSGIPNPKTGTKEWGRKHLSTMAMDRFVVKSSKGLAEVSKSTRSVQFIHESVRDFLVKEDGLRELWPELGDKFESLSHDRLKQCCDTYLAVDVSGRLPCNEICPDTPDHTVEAWERNVSKAFPFLKYATHGVLHHAEEAAISQPQDSFLDEFPLKHWIKLRNLFEQDYNCRYTTNASLLYILAERNGMRLMQSLPWPNPDLLVRGERRRYPFFAALNNGHQEAAMFLLRQETGLQIDRLPERPACVPGFMPRSLLLWAAKLGDDSLVTLLLQSSIVDMDSKDADKRTALSVASEHGREPVVRRLLATKQVDVNSKSSSGRTPLAYSAWLGHEAVARLLLATAAVDVDARDGWGRTPLFHSAEGGHEAIVRLLLATNAVDVNRKDAMDWTPLFVAATQGHDAIVRLLVATNAAVDPKDRWNRTPLSHAAEKGHGGIVQQLIATDAVDINSRDDNGWTPLFYASERGCDAVVQLLLAAPGIDVAAKSKSNRTPMQVAARQQQRSTVGILRAAMAVKDGSARSGGGRDEDAEA